MDWDSPTTTKHAAEAKAQGCELLGAGKNSRNRTYRLPCGHEQEVDLAAMRRSYFRCRTCVNSKLEKEAEAQGVELLGAGKNRSYRNYRLPCGHVRELQPSNVRAGEFRCLDCLEEKHLQEALDQGIELIGPGTKSNCRRYRCSCGHEWELQITNVRKGEFLCEICLQNKLEKEAEAQNCKLLGGGKNYNLRTYRLPCGHEREVATSHMRSGRFGCQICLWKKMELEASSQGCEIIGPGKTVLRRTYKLPCGHLQDITLGAMRAGAGYFRCATCLDEKLRAEAAVQDCSLIGPGSNSHHRTYLLSCGHEQNVNLSAIRSGSFRCAACFQAKLKNEAKAQDLILIGPGKNRYYRTYKLPCGHEQEIWTSSVRKGVFCCQTCEDYWYTQPSQTYLLHINAGGYEWLKLGYAKNLDYRISMYGLPTDAEVSVLAILTFNTGKEAQEFERSLHKKYKRKRLRAKDMLDFHTGSGATECYPLTMVETLMREIKAGQ